VQEISAAKEKLGATTPLIEIYTTVYEGTYAMLSAWAERLHGWRIETLRLQHQIWLRTAQRPISRSE